MADRTKHQLLNYFIAAVWIANGLFCKVLNLVPRHQEIVGRILGNGHSRFLTSIIGFSEIAMAIWILSNLCARLNVIIQILIIIAMNSLEFFLASDLLLWGKANAVFAFLFILLIYCNEFHIIKKQFNNSVFSFLKNHPFAVEAFFRSSLVFTFAIPKEQIEHLVPECLELDIFNGKWAFIAIAMVQTEKLRPKGFPKFAGNDFFLIGYRIFVRFTNNEGKNLRGLYILKSETDKKKMEFFGNIFTHYNYTTTDITQKKFNNEILINSNKSGFKIKIENSDNEDVSLPDCSPFTDWKEARRFAGPLPFTFTYNDSEKKVLIIEGVRENWKPMPVKVLDYKFAFLDNLKLNDIKLANAFIIKNIPYHWKKGKIEQWTN